MRKLFWRILELEPIQSISKHLLCLLRLLHFQLGLCLPGLGQLSQILLILLILLCLKLGSSLAKKSDMIPFSAMLPWPNMMNVRIHLYHQHTEMGKRSKRWKMVSLALLSWSKLWFRRNITDSNHDSTKQPTRSTWIHQGLNLKHETSQNHVLLRLLLTLGVRQAFQGLPGRWLRADTLDALHALHARLLHIDLSFGLRCLSRLEGPYVAICRHISPWSWYFTNHTVTLILFVRFAL